MHSRIIRKKIGLGIIYHSFAGRLETKEELDQELGEYLEIGNSRINFIRGRRLTELGDYSSAIYHCHEVLKDSALLDAANLSKTFNMLSIPQLELKDFVNCLHSLKKAISLDPDYTDPYENLGDLYVAQDDYGKAMFNYQKAIVLATGKKRKIALKELPTIQELELSTEKTFLLSHIVAKANGWLKYYDFDSNKDHLTHALNTFELADKLVDVIRSESTEFQSKLFWREKGASLYTKAVEACYLLDMPEKAFYFMERNKALLLLEDISSEQAKEITKLPNALAEREFELKRDIFLSENEFKNFESSSSDSLDLIKQKVFTNKRIYNTFVDSLAMAFPEYAEIKKKVDVMPYADFKAKFITGGEAVLQYILNDEQGYGLLTSIDQTHFFKLENTPLLNEKIIALYTQLTDLTSSKEKIANYNRLAHEVFQVVLPQDVFTTIKGKNLTIVSDNILQQIPFEALVVDSEQGRYLIEEVEIRYAYSMSYLSAKKEIAQNPEKAFLGLAPIQFATLGLPQLAFSGEEINEVNKIYSGETALNGDATKSRLLDGMDNFKILHLSTHADVGSGTDPWIAFSDEKMFLNEIYAAKNQADMVVLSGCNTSLGELKKGEGAMSLARGFFHSGAKSVVSSL